MALTASSIIQRAVQVLQDTTSVRWPTDELVRWLNDAQRELVLFRPDSNTKYGTGTLATGTRQDMNAMAGITNPAKLIDIVRNMAAGSNKGAVRLTAREILDAQVPGWHAMTGSINTIHYMFDVRDPRSFYVYPPAAGAQLEIVYSAYPADVPAPTGTDFTGVSGMIGVADIYGNAILDYILYRAYSKDSEYAGNGPRAAAHYGAFANSMGIEIKGTVANSPSVNVTYNPNNPAMNRGPGSPAA